MTLWFVFRYMYEDPIAIVGLGGIFPGAASVEQFWQNIEQGTSAAREVPQGRWQLPLEAAFDPERGVPDHVYSRRGCYVTDVTCTGEGLSLDPALLPQLDPVFHLALYAARDALRDANVSAQDRSRAGVIIGNIALPTEKTSAITADILGPQFEEHVLAAAGQSRPTAADTPATHPLNRHAVGLVAGMIARAFGFGGGSYTVDGACAASLYAVNFAVSELQADRADLMLTGGVCRPDNTFTQMGFSQLRALSPSGVCAPFDERGDGLVVGEGAGMFVLKRLADAIRDADQIYAVIRGVGLSNDRQGTLLAPESEGQVRAMRAAYQQAGWTPQEVGLIECHATGTPVGDAVEIASLKTLWGESDWQPGQCVIGGVKSNVGHLLTAAGAAGLLKTVLALNHRTLPPMANFTRPNPALELAASPFQILTQARTWEAAAPRKAAVSAFGFGGINAHVLLEEWQPDAIGRQASTAVSRQRPTADQRPQPIAIVGLDAHFGPWDSLRAFQERVLGGGEPIEPSPKHGCWGLESNPHARIPNGFFIDELAIPFGRFRIPPKEIKETLPQQLLMLQVAANALKDAGGREASDKTEDTLRTGVFIGIGLDFNATNFSYRWRIAEKARQWAAALHLNVTEAELRDWTQALRDAFNPPLTANRTVGALGGIVASRIAREFHCGAASLTVSSEETSGLCALEAAARSLQRGELDQAIVGAVDLHGDIRSLLTAQAERGRVETTMPQGEGAAAVIVKRLADAERDGDTVYAVIHGFGAASGDAGACRVALERAYAEANLAPAAIQYVETAGTDDADETRSLTHTTAQFFGQSERPQTCAFGSVEAEIGYTGAAAGLAALVKTCLCLHQQILPPDHNRATQPQHWLRNRADGPRRAGVTAASADGNCVHVVLAAFERPHAPAALQTERLQPLGARSEALFAVEADDRAGLQQRLTELQTYVQQYADLPVEALARGWYQQTGIVPDKQRGAALIARDAAELQQQIETLRQTLAAPSAATDGRVPGNRIFYRDNPLGLLTISEHSTSQMLTAFVFPGSGSHYPGMGREIAAQWPEIVRRQDAGNQRLRDQYAPDLFWNAASGAMPRLLLLGQVTYSTLMTDLLRSFGIRPHAAVGYSLGESSALFALRAWTERDEMLRRTLTSSLFTHDLAGELRAARQVWNLPDAASVDWSLAVVHCPVATVRTALTGRERVYLLIINTPQSCVIGGDRPAVTAVLEAQNWTYQWLEGVSAAHCEVIQPVAQAYRAHHFFASTVAPEGISVYSGGWGRAYSVTPDSAADAILAQAADTIDFPALIQQAYADGVRVFIEVGPGNSCATMIDNILADQPHVAVSACAANSETVFTVLRLLGILIAERAPIDLTHLYGQDTCVVAHRTDTTASKARALNIPTNRPAFQIEIPARKEKGGRPQTEICRPQAAGRRRPTAGMERLIRETMTTQTGNAEAHAAYLRFAQNMTASFERQAAAQMTLFETVGNSQPAAPGPQSAVSGSQPPVTRQPIFMDREQCLEFAVGSIANVLGAEFAEADTYPTRVRLPDEPLMLVDRILEVEGEPRSLTHGRVVTEHDIYPDDWYLDCGRIPTCIAVESGQADLFLSGYLGIDFVTKGQAVYRLLDAAVTFHGPLPGPAAVIRYEIHIDEFFRQGKTYLFRFRFESTVDGAPFLSMENGCAGFFTPTALDEGQGLVFTEMDLRPLPGKTTDDWRPLVALEAESYSDAQVDALRRGDLAACFGSQFTRLPLRRPCRLPGGLMKLVHRVLRIQPTGGRYGLGQIRGEADIHPDDWFLTCHFMDDQVMPGTLMYECCLHTLRILLMRMGWVGEQDAVAWEPVPGVTGQLKCRGQVVASTQKVVYEIALKEIGYRPEPYVICDALMYADGRPVVSMTDMSLQLSGMTRAKLERLWRSAASRTSGAGPQYVRKPALFDADSILAFAIGKPSEAFGARYRVFDSERVIARLRGPPYQFLDRVTAVQGEQWVMTADKQVEAQYDVPPEAWYFSANRQPTMPFAVLLEIVLQPCGWLAAYAGSALTSDEDLSFRNLGGQAAQFLPVGPQSGTLTTTAAMTSVSASGGMIIQHYDYHLTNSAGQIVYQGNTYFGFFTKRALANQIGIQAVQPYQPTEAEVARGAAFAYPTDAPFPDTQLRMIDHIDLFAPDGGPQGLGFVRGTKAVAPDEWFFKAHFYQDPVCPGSLGLESLAQLLKVAAVQRWGWRPGERFETVVLRQPHHWTYRGQILPTDHEVTVQAVITAVDDAQRMLRADGFLSVDGRLIYQMQDFTLRMNR